MFALLFPLKHHGQTGPAFVGGVIPPVAPVAPVRPPVQSTDDYDVWRSGGEQKGHGHETEITRIKVYNFTSNANGNEDVNVLATELPPVTESGEKVVVESTLAPAESVNDDRGRDQIN